MSDMVIDDEIQLEHEEELDRLVFSGENDTPIFESVRVTKKDFSVYELYRKYKREQLILDVDFQRRKVWEPRQKSELIESILMGLPLPLKMTPIKNINATAKVWINKTRLAYRRFCKNICLNKALVLVIAAS